MQYPGEKEITFPPFTCLESDGEPRVETTEEGEVAVFPLKVALQPQALNILVNTTLRWTRPASGLGEVRHHQLKRPASPRSSKEAPGPGLHIHGSAAVQRQ